MSLVEIMVAAFILTVALLALASTATASLISLSTSLGRQEAMDAASAMIEDLRRTNYALVALDASEVAAAALDASDPDVVAIGPDFCDARYNEPLVTSNQADTLPRTQQFGPSGRITLTTTVSWYDESDGSDAGCTHGDRNVKRVRVQAEWVDRGRSFTLEESTLVAPVDRGLPAPDFRLGPPEHELEYHWSDIADEVKDSKERCLPHALRNLGATDGYEWEIRRVGQGAPAKAYPAVYELADSRWFIRAFLEFPLADPPSDPAGLVIPTHNQRTVHPDEPLELLIDVTGNNWPETETRLEAGDQARLWVCYRPGKSAGQYEGGDSWKFQVTVRSQFDPNRFEVVEHEVTVVDQFIRLFLLPDSVLDPEVSSHNRVRVVQGNTEGLPVLPMGPDHTMLWSTDGLPNYDMDFTTLAGMRLKDGPRTGETEDPWPASRVRFHYQVSPTTTFHPTVNLRLFSLAEEFSLAKQADPDAEIEAPELEYRIRLEVLRRNENAFNPPVVVLDETRSYTHDEAGWMQLWTEPFTLLGGDLTIDNDRYLRLDIICLSTDHTCHIGFGHEDFRSSLRLQVRS